MAYTNSTNIVLNFISKACKLSPFKINKLKNQQIIPLDTQIKNDYELANDTKITDSVVYLDSDDYFSSNLILAYTIANVIHIKKSKYNPGSTETTEILNHELTHVQQYSENRINTSTDELEFEATQNETLHFRQGKEVHWIEIMSGKYSKMTEIEYKQFLNQVAESFEESINEELMRMNEEQQLEFLLKLQNWSESPSCERFASKEESSFSNMNYYQKKEEYIKKHLWKTAAQVDYDTTEAMKRIIRG